MFTPTYLSQQRGSQIWIRDRQHHALVRSEMSCDLGPTSRPCFCSVESSVQVCRLERTAARTPSHSQDTAQPVDAKREVPSRAGSCGTCAGVRMKASHNNRNDTQSALSSDFHGLPRGRALTRWELNLGPGLPLPHRTTQKTTVPSPKCRETTYSTSRLHGRWPGQPSENYDPPSLVGLPRLAIHRESNDIPAVGGSPRSLEPVRNIAI